MSRLGEVEELYGVDSAMYRAALDGDPGTCLLPKDHHGPHEFTFDGAVTFTFGGHAVIEKVISGGQTGSDQAGLFAATRAGIPTGGFAARGWLVESPAAPGVMIAEDEPAPWLADYGLVECPEPGYAARRRANVELADAVLLFGRRDSHGSLGLIRDCANHKPPKPLLWIEPGVTTPRHAAEFLRTVGCRTLMIAGNRASIDPDLGPKVERFLGRVFAILNDQPVPRVTP